MFDIVQSILGSCEGRECSFMFCNMEVKLLCLVLLAVVAQGSTAAAPQTSLIQVQMEDVNLPISTTEAKIFGISKHYQDTLLTCHIIFPNGLTYEAFPNSNIPDPNIYYSSFDAPFNLCTVEFKGVSKDRSGTYEMISITEHAEGYYQTITRQRYHITVLTCGVEKECFFSEI